VVKQDRILGNYYADISFLDGFNLRSSIGLDYRAGQNLNFSSANTAAVGGEAPSSTSNGGSKRFMYTWENILSYHKSLNNHNLYATLVQSVQSETSESYGISVKDLPYDQQLYYNVGTALTINGISSGYYHWNLSSFMGRLNYNYKEKYLATVSGRYDGSSVLAEGHKWVVFPSVALAWRMKSEPFLKDIKVLNELKLRVGWGRTGNSGIAPYKTWGSLSTVRYAFGETSVLGFTPADMINPALTWETTGQYNAGIDFGFFDGRISGSIDIYKQTTNNLLLNQQLPTASGFDQILVNIGKTSNKGLELAFNTVNISTHKLRWSTDWIFAGNKQKILELYNGKHDDLAAGWFIGQPIQVAYNVTADGIWQNTDEDKAEIAKFMANGATFKPGDIRPLDLNHDYKIDAADRHIFGQAEPKWTASLGNTFQYGNFDASIFLYASVGQTVYHDLDMRFDGRYNQPKLDYWTPENPSKTYPRPLLGTAGLNYVSILNYYDGSFVRVKNISLGYTLPVPIAKQAFLERFRIYASVQNPWVITKFPGTDPEGATGFNAPSVTTYLLGVNLNF
ncbi:MAG TPA: SusC/RagA family TonB-linked outer membrane protein, partial [Flavitalea sp.]|nr:SusC/RagA family TonB-linked outer membrane protein [Flavitalea sp.]